MKRFVVIGFLIISCACSWAQDNLPMIDFKTVHFGFHLGMNIMDFGIKQSNMLQGDRVYKAEVSTLMPGFSVGVIGDVRICEYLSFRLVPSLHLSDRTLSFSNDVDGDILHTSIKSTIVTVPGYFKINGPRIKNYRPYLMLGGGVLFDFGRDRQQPVLLKQTDYFVEFGGGCTIYLKYFRLSPEIKFAMGFRNVLEPWENRTSDVILPGDEIYTLAISKLTTRLFSLCLNFE